MAWDFYILSSDDLLGKLMKTLGIKRWLERTHLVQKDTKRPNVRLERVGVRLDDLGREVVWGSNDSLGF